MGGGFKDFSINYDTDMDIVTFVTKSYCLLTFYYKMLHFLPL